MFDVVLTVVDVLSPTLFAVAIESVSRKAKRGRAWSIGVIAFGLAISGVTTLQIYRSDLAHRHEVREQLAKGDSLRAELVRSELEQRESSAYFHAKLDDQIHFCGVASELAAGINVLAATGADYERRLYESKVANNDLLYQLTMKVVTRIRDFSERRQQMSDEEMREDREVALAPDLSNAQEQNMWDQIFDKYRETSHSRDREFHSILGDVLNITTELQKRKLAEPRLDPAIRGDVNRAMDGILAGVDPEVHLADYLQAWVKPLEPRQKNCNHCG